MALNCLGVASHGQQWPACEIEGIRGNDSGYMGHCITCYAINDIYFHLTIALQAQSGIFIHMGHDVPC